MSAQSVFAIAGIATTLAVGILCAVLASTDGVTTGAEALVMALSALVALSLQASSLWYVTRGGRP